MAAKMTVVIVKATGNVLGAMTRRGDPTGKLDPATYLSKGFLVREPADLTDRLTLPPDALDVQVVDLIEDALTNPTAYYFANNAVTQATGTTITIAQTPSVNPPKPWSVGLGTNKKQAIWVQMESVTDQTTLFGQATAPDSGVVNVDVPFAVAPGTYNCVIFATGAKPAYKKALAVS